MARDNIKHGNPQVSITMIDKRGNSERNSMCSREIGGRGHGIEHAICSISSVGVLPS